MAIKNTLNYFSHFRSVISLKIRNIYLTSSFYNKKISKLKERSLIYKPNSSIIGCIVKYKKQKQNINNFLVDSIWKNENINNSNYKKLHSFFWLFSIDLKSSNKITQSIIEDWIDKNIKYNDQNWEVDILSKRIISWISNSKLTYEDSSENYKYKFNFVIQKQINHLINEINRSESVDDKLIGCTAIVLTGLSFKDDSYINYGFKLIKSIIRYSLDVDGFPKSRNFRQLAFYLKYFVLIRELLKDSQNEIPDYLDETIYYLGQAYNLLWQSNKQVGLFNGNHETDYYDFDEYLKMHGYNFKSNSNLLGGYILLKNKKNSIIMDVGKVPDKKFSQNYQSGILSFEFIYSGQKIICNSGYYQKQDHQLNDISRSTAVHSTVIIDNLSVTRFSKNNMNNKYALGNVKIFDKKIINEKEKMFLAASHDGYLKTHGIIHKREIEYDIKKYLLKGKDALIKNRKFKPSNFEIRFHLYPSTKVTKTIDRKTVLIEVENSGWRFTCSDFLVDVETGLYFGKKNSYTENQNLFIYGETKNYDQIINWELKKI